MAYREWDGAVIDRTEGQNWLATDHAPIAPTLSPELWAEPPDAPPPRLPHVPDCPEIDCLHAILPRWLLTLAALRAAEAGVGADRVLIAEGAISEETYVAALANWLGMNVEPLHWRARHECPLPDDGLIQAAKTGLLPLSTGSGIEIVVAPQLVDSRRLVELAMMDSDVSRRLRLTSTARLRGFVARHGGHAIARRAVDGLRNHRPELSANGRHPGSLAIGGVFAALAVALAFIVAREPTVLAVQIVLGFVFMAWTALRLFSILGERLVRRRPRTYGDDDLPVYTIIVALYREAAAVGDLVAALRRLDYPPEKLDIKLVIEPDDDGTRDAIARLKLAPPFEVVVAPRQGPRTKPKALNAALALARGMFVAVYDAEDQPEPNQLRLALEAFAAGDRRLACVQAALTIDNTADSWLARMFTAEYAGLFDVFLPGLSGWRLPLPLGGSSNHFRASVLRRVGAWDPYNVTEDADLGMRLARFGYRTAIIPSTTYEEAPARIGGWLRQRTRWCKGWIQTWLVHMRSPARLMRDLGVSGFLVFNLLVGGTVAAALIHALFAAQLAASVAVATWSGAADSASIELHAAMLLAGYLVSAALGVVGLARRGLLRCSWALLLIPVYWLLLSVAAWRALWQLFRDPYRWEKTEHGLALTSRLAERAAQR